jgi:signal transduction histidine kinase/ActR/RegA family two-component response regulator
LPRSPGSAFDQILETPTLWVERLHPDDRSRVIAALATRPSGNALAVEYRWQCADGQYRHFLDQAVLLRDARGNPVEYAGTLLDVTDRKDLETQLLQARKMDAIGKLTGGIAHDFNNLLAAVLGGLGLLERRVELAEDQRKVLTMTRHAAEQGSELVGRLLSFARRQKLEPAAVEISRLSANVTDLLAHTLGGLVELEWEMEDSLWCAYADEAQLELVLMNLIINARDAMPEGGRISIAAGNRELRTTGDFGLPPGDYMVLAVTDTGCGIAPEMLEQVMEPFFTTKEVGKGTGLGLSMVYGFVKQSGGAIKIDSKVGTGTRVEIWLPRAPAAIAEASTAAPAEAAAKRGRSLNILLVDDHPGVRATTAALLEDLGHKVREAVDGREGIRLLKQDPGAIDLIISDYAMPVVSGTEVIQKARRIKRGMPAIIITGYAEAQSISRRPDDVPVLAKPFTPEQLSAAINAVSGAGEEPVEPKPLPQAARA